ncbi:hypothetical protein EV1_021489 [Malus domestica]
MTINDMVEVKQYEHESTEDFMMRFRKTRMRCQFPVNQAQLISITQRALKLPLRKRFYDTQFNELQEVVIAATRYEKLLLEEQQVKHTSKTHPFYKNKATIHHVEVGKIGPEQEDDHDREEIEPPKYQSYSFDLAKAPEIYEELVRARVIVPDSTKKMPKPEELRGKKYCKLLLDKPQASMMVDTNPFPEAPINAIRLV